MATTCVQVSVLQLEVVLDFGHKASRLLQAEHNPHCQNAGSVPAVTFTPSQSVRA
jgi:hypothetical protein